MPKPCRHRQTWIICSGMNEWCYVCGALRRLQLSKVSSPWCLPTQDPKADNPYSAWDARTLVYQKRMFRRKR